MGRARRVRRPTAILFFAAVLALTVVFVVAVLDHQGKTSAKNEAHRAEWFCRHRGTQCGRRSSVSIEAAWARRERFYGGACIVLGGVTTLLAVIWALSRRVERETAGDRS